jgi:hypothetical protein
MQLTWRFFHGVPPGATWSITIAVPGQLLLLGPRWPYMTAVEVKYPCY